MSVVNDDACTGEGYVYLRVIRSLPFSLPYRRIWPDAHVRVRVRGEYVRVCGDYTFPRRIYTYTIRSWCGTSPRISTAPVTTTTTTKTTIRHVRKCIIASTGFFLLPSEYIYVYMYITFRHPPEWETRAERARISVIVREN